MTRAIDSRWRGHVTAAMQEAVPSLLLDLVRICTDYLFLPTKAPLRTEFGKEEAFTECDRIFQLLGDIYGQCADTLRASLFPSSRPVDLAARWAVSHGTDATTNQFFIGPSDLLELANPKPTDCQLVLPRTDSMVRIWSRRRHRDQGTHPAPTATWPSTVQIERVWLSPYIGFGSPEHKQRVETDFLRIYSLSHPSATPLVVAKDSGSLVVWDCKKDSGPRRWTLAEEVMHLAAVYKDKIHDESQSNLFWQYKDKIHDENQTNLLRQYIQAIAYARWVRGFLCPDDLFPSNIMSSGDSLSTGSPHDAKSVAKADSVAKSDARPDVESVAKFRFAKPDDVKYAAAQPDADSVVKSAVDSPDAHGEIQRGLNSTLRLAIPSLKWWHVMWAKGPTAFATVQSDWVARIRQMRAGDDPHRAFRPREHLGTYELDSEAKTQPTSDQSFAYIFTAVCLHLWTLRTPFHRRGSRTAITKALIRGDSIYASFSSRTTQERRSLADAIDDVRELDEWLNRRTTIPITDITKAALDHDWTQRPPLDELIETFFQAIKS